MASCSFPCHVQTCLEHVRSKRGQDLVEKFQINLQQKFMKPRKAWTSVLFSRVGHSRTPTILTGSMETLFFKMTRPKYLIHSLQNSHFSGQRKSLFSYKICSIHQIAFACSSSILVKIKMLSRQTTIMLSAMRSWKMLFIMVWKVAGLLVIPENITKSLNMPRLVWKATFHWSPGLMWMLLKPQQTSSLVKDLAPQS